MKKLSNLFLKRKFLLIIVLALLLIFMFFTFKELTINKTMDNTTTTILNQNNVSAEITEDVITIKKPGRIETV